MSMNEAEMNHFWKRPSTPSQSTPASKSEMQLLTSMSSMSSIERKELLNILLNKSKARKDAKGNQLGRKRPHQAMTVKPVATRPTKRGRSAEGGLQLVICDFSAADLAKLRQTSPSTTATPIDNQALQAFKVPVQTLSPTDAAARACLDNICESAKTVSGIELKISAAPVISTLPKTQSANLALSLSSMVYDEWKAKAANSLKAPKIDLAASLELATGLDLSLGDSTFDAVGSLGLNAPLGLGLNAPLGLNFSW